MLEGKLFQALIYQHQLMFKYTANTFLPFSYDILPFEMGILGWSYQSSRLFGDWLANMCSLSENELAVTVRSGMNEPM